MTGQHGLRWGVSILAGRSVGVPRAGDMSRSYRGCRASGAGLQTPAGVSCRGNRTWASCQGQSTQTAPRPRAGGRPQEDSLLVDLRPRPAKEPSQAGPRANPLSPQLSFLPNLGKNLPRDHRRDGPMRR